MRSSSQKPEVHRPGLCPHGDGTWAPQADPRGLRDPPVLIERHGCHGHAAQAGTHHCDAAPASFPGSPSVCRVPSSSPGHWETGNSAAHQAPPPLMEPQEAARGEAGWALQELSGHFVQGTGATLRTAGLTDRDGSLTRAPALRHRGGC
ncbi:unnamed protein product [Rangifer tarandus platyrhynchus]|uniref:Uncharacterized protein n=1 Tax=Rangifer tarandus platyrhynchus TaxID=3082113 RepID=A0AC60A9Y2_RANTA